MISSGRNLSVPITNSSNTFLNQPAITTAMSTINNSTNIPHSSKPMLSGISSSSASSSFDGTSGIMNTGSQSGSSNINTVRLFFNSLFSVF